MLSLAYRGGSAACFALLCFAVVVVPARAVGPYTPEPSLSIAGVCGVKDAIDPVEDPECPGGTHPPSGRFSEPRSVAIDAYGNEYVASYAFDGTKGRIDVFNDEGKFITELLDPFGPKS
ncbi:MAG TPA: hypothetical protein VIL21_09540, partial [Solirubrobacterales bacterium]